ncbi:MAG: hypothetical protein ACRD40_08890, partial [Candidatus Acidiferrales bacterium]
LSQSEENRNCQAYRVTEIKAELLCAPPMITNPSRGELKSSFALSGIWLEADVRAGIVHRRRYGSEGQIK